jgi:hypothetical protein
MIGGQRQYDMKVQMLSYPYKLLWDSMGQNYIFKHQFLKLY